MLSPSRPLTERPVWPGYGTEAGSTIFSWGSRLELPVRGSWGVGETEMVAVAPLLVHEELPDALFAWRGQPPHQFRLQCLVGLSLQWGRNDVFHFHLSGVPVVELRDDVVELRPLAGDGCQLRRRLATCDFLLPANCCDEIVAIFILWCRC
jgi:hypothetical protein